MKPGFALPCCSKSFLGDDSSCWMYLLIAPLQPRCFEAAALLAQKIKKKKKCENN